MLLAVIDKLGRPLRTDDLSRMNFKLEALKCVDEERSVRLFESDGKENLVERSSEDSVAVMVDGFVYEMGEPDTSVGSISNKRIRKLWKRRGECAAEHLSGEFSLIIWEKDKRRVTGLRDCIGSRPLYFAETRSVVIIASQIDLITSHPDIPTEPNDRYIYGYLHPDRSVFRYARLAGQDTIHRAVRRVPPRHYVIIDSTGIAVRPYRPLRLDRSLQVRSEHEARETFTRLISQAVSRRVSRADRIGLLLSGGLDSSSILAEVANEHVKAHMTTFTFYRQNQDERTFVQALLERYNFEATFRDFGDVWLLSHMPTTPAKEEPGNSFSHIEHTRRISDWCQKSHSDVILTGVGGGSAAGEIVKLGHVVGAFQAFKVWTLLKDLYAWAPYMNTTVWALLNRRCIYPLLHRCAPTDRWASLVDRARESSMSVLDKEFCRKVEQTLEYNESLIPKFEDNNVHLGTREEVLFTPQLMGEYSILPLDVGISHPFLDLDLINFSIKVNARFLYSPVVKKDILRRSMSERLPSLVLNRKGKMPANYSRSLSKGWRTVTSFLEKLELERTGYVNRACVQRIADAARRDKGVPYYQIRQLINLELCFRRYFQ